MLKKTKDVCFYVTTALMIFVGVFFIHPATGLHGFATGNQGLLGNGENYTALLYDSSNGLPTSEANAIVQSQDGFIWLGGYSGLIRYDGSTFYRFDSSSGISSVFSLYVDSKDRVWIGTNENGIAYYDHGDIFVYGRVEGLKSFSIRAITEDDQGNILIATTQGLAYVGADDMKVHVIDDPQVNMEYITELLNDGRGNIYGLTQNGNVFEVQNLRIGAFYFAKEFGQELVNCIYPDPDREGIVYIGTADSKVMKVDMMERAKIVQEKTVTPLKNINALMKKDNLYWICATNGIGYLDEKLSFHKIEDIPLNNSIGNIMQDHEGNVWFTSTRQGVMKLVSDRFTDISKYAGLGTMVVNSTCVKDGLLYIAGDNGLVILQESNYKKVQNELTQMLDGIRIRCIKKDSKDNLWLCTHGDYGLVRYATDGTIKCFNEENGLMASKIRTVLETRDGNIVAATAGNGVFVIQGEQVIAQYGHENGIRTADILAIEEDTSGKLYLGSDGDGVYVVDGSKVSRIGYEDGLTSEVVLRLKWDRERKFLWIITSNSISYLKDGNITVIKNFPYSNNYDIVFNNHGGAWVLSSNGIYVTRVSDILGGGKIEYTFYNTKSGLPYIATGNSRSYLDEKGQLYIAGTTGVCKVDINADTTNYGTVKLAIPSVELDDRIVPLKDGQILSVPAGCQRIVIDAYALTYGLSNPRISYYLEGFDKEPIHTTKQEMKSILYTNLDGGKYKFHLEVLDDITGEVAKSLVVPIVKESSLYENVGFWIALMTILILVIILVMYRHFQKKEAILVAKNEEDQKFINQIIHTFAKCVDMRDTQNRGHSFRVAYYTRMLAEKLAEKRGYTKEKINEFYNIALLHDIGKISIPDAILNKPGRLNDEEYVIMKSHAMNGELILREVNIVPNLAVGAGCHHERLDGRGYPRGLSGDAIPEVAKMVAVADTFDAMYSTRPYRKQMPITDVLAELERIKGTQLDPEVVDAMFELFKDQKLDKEEVDRATAYDDKPLDLNGEAKEIPGSKKKEQEKQNEEFLKSLGLHQEKKDD